MTLLKMEILNVDDIRVPPARIRKSLGNLEGLVKSIESKGQLHPIIINKSKLLIAGERRLEACRALGVDVLVRYREDLSDADMVEIEVMENAARLDFTWVESVAAVEKLHKLKVEQFGPVSSGRSKKGWSYMHTGELLGRSGESIRLDLKIAEYMKEYPELAKLPKKFIAYKRVRDILEDSALMELAKRAQEGRLEMTAEERKSDIFTADDIIDLPGLTEEEKTQAMNILDMKSDDEGLTTEELIEQQLISIAKNHGTSMEIMSKRLILGDAFKEMKKMKKESFELIITDPPYGIDIDTTIAVKEIGVFDDSKDWIHQNMPNLFKECWRVLKPNSHMYVFFAITYYDFLLKEAEKVGFEVDPLPLIWVKGKYTGKSGDPIKYPGRAYEMVMYLRKGNMPLAQRGMRNVIIEDPVVGVNKIHPTEKPAGVIKDLLIRSGHPGIRILDPMAGSGTVIEVAMKRGLFPIGIEMDKNYHARALDRLNHIYQKLAVPQMRALAEEEL